MIFSFSILELTQLKIEKWIQNRLKIGSSSIFLLSLEVENQGFC